METSTKNVIRGENQSVPQWSLLAGGAPVAAAAAAVVFGATIGAAAALTTTISANAAADFDAGNEAMLGDAATNMHQDLNDEDAELVAEHSFAGGNDFSANFKFKNLLRRSLSLFSKETKGKSSEASAEEKLDISAPVRESFSQGRRSGAVGENIDYVVKQQYPEGSSERVTLVKNTSQSKPQKVFFEKDYNLPGEGGQARKGTVTYTFTPKGNNGKFEKGNGISLFGSRKKSSINVDEGYGMDDGCEPEEYSTHSMTRTPSKRSRLDSFLGVFRSNSKNEKDEEHQPESEEEERPCVRKDEDGKAKAYFKAHGRPQRSQSVSNLRLNVKTGRKQRFKCMSSKQEEHARQFLEFHGLAHRMNAEPETISTSVYKDGGMGGAITKRGKVMVKNIYDNSEVSLEDVKRRSRR